MVLSARIPPAPRRESFLRREIVFETALLQPFIQIACQDDPARAAFNGGENADSGGSSISHKTVAGILFV